MAGPEFILVALDVDGLGKVLEFSKSVIIMKVREIMRPNILQVLHACLSGHSRPPAEVRAAWRSLNP
jgi:hypothetical protein